MPELNLVLISRPDAVGDGEMVGHLWRKTGSLVVVSEISDDFRISGVTVLDARYVESLKRRFAGRRVYETVLGKTAPAPVSKRLE